MARQMVWARYTTDTGGHRAAKIAKEFRSDATLGFAAFNAADVPIKPSEMRYVTLADPTTGRRRRVPVGNVTATVWTGVAPTVDILEVGSATATTWTVIKRFGESLDVAHAVLHPATATSD